jgi:protein ImuB
MLYLCLSLPQLPLEARLSISETAVAVTDRRGSKRWLIACNPACLNAGIRPGLNATAALTMRPELKLVERSRPQELEALKFLAAWAEQFSSWVSFDAGRLLAWLEIGTSLRYFQGLDSLRSRIESGLTQLGYSAAFGIAPTLEAAAALCQLDDPPAIDEETKLAEGIRRLPLGALALDEDAADALADMGLQTHGDLIDLPRESLARRFGPELVDYLDRLAGTAPDPHEPYHAPSKFRRRFELLGAVESTEGLLFPLRRLLNELQGYLLARDTALQSVQIRMRHEGCPPTCLEIRTTRPMRDAVRLFALVRERLERTVLPAPVEEIAVAANRFVPLGDTQIELLDGSKRRDEDWSGLLDKLRARLGNSAVRQLGLRDDHRPERAWCVVDGKVPEIEVPHQERPLWLMEPRLIGILPRRLGQPERIEAGWADGEDESRDYYIAETGDGARLWLYRNAGKGQWYIHGLWA